MERRKAKFLVNKRTFLSKLLSPVNAVIVFFLLQIGLIVLMLIRFYDLLDRIFAIISIINFIMIIRIFSDKQSIPEFKLTWATIILGMPLLGTLFYFFTDYDIGHYRLKKELIKVIDDSKGIISQDATTKEALKKHPDLYQLQNYISTSGDFDFSNKTGAEYFPT
ncbi:MAG: PLDc N-terminal domain-containing protein, partial [Erysipelotrichaceae bacterium]|nr:PLDc N-terminal domain-containing protein [Erysipelotrichaceae bacterium]